MDALSEILRVIKLQGAMFFDADCRAPWCVRSPPSARLAEHLATPSSHVVEFHLLAEGRGYVRVGTETTPLSAGDLVMIPHGDPHYMGNGWGAEPIDGELSMPALLSGALRPSRLGSGDGERTRLICGYLSCEARLIQPLLVGLPRALRVPLRVDAYGELLEKLIASAVEQLAAAAPGSDVIVARLAEVLFAEALRRYLLQLSPERTGWLAAVADGAVGRALALMHQRPAHAWTVDALAQEVGLSRSALSERFARYLGQGVMTYLANWRMQLAAEALRTTSRSVVQIAAEVGYDSEAAFNRAFKRRFEAPPARYRKAVRSTPAMPRVAGTSSAS